MENLLLPEDEVDEVKISCIPCSLGRDFGMVEDAEKCIIASANGSKADAEYPSTVRDMTGSGSGFSLSLPFHTLGGDPSSSAKGKNTDLARLDEYTKWGGTDSARARSSPSGRGRGNRGPSPSPENADCILGITGFSGGDPKPSNF